MRAIQLRLSVFRAPLYIKLRRFGSSQGWRVQKLVMVDWDIEFQIQLEIDYDALIKDWLNEYLEFL